MFEFQEKCGLKLVKELVEGEKNLSRIYGFILYTRENPYVVKVLQDDAFWNALNSISGSNWPIFAVRPLHEGQRVIKGSGHGCIGYLVPTWDEPEANLPVLKDFGLNSSEDLPLFVAFMWDDNDQLNEITIPIRGVDVDTTYNSIETIVKAITRVEKDVLPEYKQTVSVFRNVKSEIESLEFKYKIINRGRILNRFADFLKMFI
jgi:hypothetical protein